MVYHPDAAAEPARPRELWMAGPAGGALVSETLGNRNRPLTAASGIEAADGLWSRLREATGQAKALAATNRKLVARVTSLERQVAEAGGLSDDELVAELPRRMSRALESAQEVAEELVSRARKREEVIRQKTDARAAAVLTQAEAEATAVLRRAATEAVGRVAEARAEAHAIMEAAHARHDRVLAHLQQQSAALENRVTQLHREHGRLQQAYEVLERTLGEAKVALRTSIEVAGSSQPSRPPRQNSPSPPPLYAVGEADLA